MEDMNNCTLTAPAPISVPANTFKVEAGQVWEDTDRRRPRKVTITSVNEEVGEALVHNVATGRKGTIRLDRFSPVHHMRRSAV